MVRVQTMALGRRRDFFLILLFWWFFFSPWCFLSYFNVFGGKAASGQHQRRLGMASNLPRAFDFTLVTKIPLTKPSTPRAGRRRVWLRDRSRPPTRGEQTLSTVTVSGGRRPA
jgi:hypothetical protein